MRYVSRSKLPQWNTLEKHKKKLGDVQIKSLFEQDNNRFNNFHLKHENIMLDYSKQPIDSNTIDKLLALAKACDLEIEREKMFSGKAINTTENRAVLHCALRTQDNTPIVIDGQDIIPQVRDALAKMKHFSDKVRKEKKFIHIVNIGIGGSDIAPSMACEALKYYSDRDIKIHFVSNIDGTHLAEVLRVINPNKTLFIITSKTFTTQETLTNAKSAKLWLQKELNCEDVSDHFVAVSQNIKLAQKFGINDNHILPIWDWVGGRYSLWSSIGLCLCISIGFENFQKMLDGAYNMDQHFINAPLDKNMPVLLAMIGIWQRNFLNMPAISITPYSQYLHRFPAYIQQLDMESNGKSVNKNNNSVEYKTGPIVIGETGTNSQHAYFQSIHQGTTIIPCDFILVAKTQNPIDGHNDKLLANAIAQSKALMEGKEDKNPHKAFNGNRPSNTIILDELNPYSLGMLLALYEHKLFVQGVIWDINSFDQCGVELGKVLAKQIIDDMKKNIDNIASDSSTLGLLKYIKDI